MRIYPGSELYYHLELTDKLSEGKVLTLAGSRYILVEFGVDVPYREMYQALSRLRMEQYHPILAHVERYRCLRKSERLEEVKKSGVLLQMNQKAFQKGLLDETGRWSRQQLVKGEIDFIASDMHNLTSREPLDEKKNSGSSYGGSTDRGISGRCNGGRKPFEKCNTVRRRQWQVCVDTGY